MVVGVLAVRCEGGEPRYLANTNLALQLLPWPAEAGSAEQAADLGETIVAHQGWTGCTEHFAGPEKKLCIFAFASSIGPFFQTNRFPKTEAFFQRVQKETDEVTATGKAFWRRPRPYQVETNLLRGDLEKGAGSYPSGHSTRATVCALLLAELFPEHRASILEEGREIGWERVVLGKHYPSDIYAGRVLGQAIVGEMKANRAFRRDFDQARIEIGRWLRSEGGEGGTHTGQGPIVTFR
jgi:acid phosphatase (class A)